MQIRAGAGAHSSETVATQPDLYDPRIVLVCQAHQGAAPRSLWSATPGGPVNPDRGAIFDRVSIGFTRQQAEADDSISLKAFGSADLAVFARTPQAFATQPHNSMQDALHSPALFGWSRHGASPTQDQTDRRCGLRAADWSDDHLEALSLVARYELSTPNRADAFAGLTPVALAVLPAGITGFAEDPGPTPYDPLDPLDPNNGVDLQTQMLLAQEQRRSDLNWSLTPRRQVAWLFTIAAPAIPFPSDGQSMTGKVLEQVTALSKRIAKDLRGVRDGRPLSLAPQFGPPSETVPHANPYKPWRWQLVGFLTDLRPSVRLIGVRADVERRLRFEHRIDLCTFEPVMVADPWTGLGAVQVPAITATATLPRVGLADGYLLTCTAAITPALRIAPEDANPADCTNAPCYQPAIADVTDIAAAPIGARLGLALTPTQPAEVEIGALRFRILKGTAGPIGVCLLYTSPSPRD